MAADIVIVDYGMGNLRSVQKAFEAVGHAAEVTADPERVRTAPRLVLPGVGAFRDAIARLRDTGLGDAVKTHIDAGRPFLGICLGLQLLFTRSHEDGDYGGLGVFPGEVVGFKPEPGLRIPHMGWNTLTLTQPTCPLWRGLPPEPAFYFVHGFYAVPTDPAVVSATADYPTPFCAALWRSSSVAPVSHSRFARSTFVWLAMKRPAAMPLSYFCSA